MFLKKPAIFIFEWVGGCVRACKKHKKRTKIKADPARELQLCSNADPKGTGLLYDLGC